MKFKRLVTIMLTLSVAVSLVPFLWLRLIIRMWLLRYTLDWKMPPLILLLAVMATRIAADQLMSRTAITQLL